MSGLLSRYAESVFWMARYIERAQSLARIIDTQTSFQRGRDDNSWAWIVALYSDEKDFAKDFEEPGAENVIHFYMAHAATPGSILSSIRAARENARALRPILPTDMWYHLNDFYNNLLAFGSSEYSEVRLSRTCDAIKRGCYAQIGIAKAVLYRDEMWPFFQLGLQVECTDQTSRLLDVRFAQQQTGLTNDVGRLDFTFWTILLRAASAYHSYRRVSPRNIDPKEVARFLMFDPGLPRSLAYCLGGIQAMMELLKRDFGLCPARVVEQVDAMMAGLTRAAQDEHLLEKLHSFNDWMQLRLIQLTDELGQAFFGYQQSPAEPEAPLPILIQTQSQTQTQSQVQL